MKTWHFGDKVGNDFDFAASTFEFGGQPIITDSLLAWWKHEEGTGTILGDSRGSFDGTVGGTLTNFWDNTTLDGVPVGTYDGSTNSVEGIGTGLDISTAITIMAAFYPGESPATDSRHLIAKRNDGSTGTNYALDLNDTTDELRFYYFPTGLTDGQVYITNDFDFAASTWYIMTVTFTYGTGASMQIYKNLTLCGGSWTLGDGTAAAGGSDAYVFIGAQNAAGDGITAAKYFLGRLGDILIYNKVLSLAEITQNFNTLRDRYGL